MSLIQHLRPASLALIAVALSIPLGNGLAHADEVAQTRAERREHRQEASEGRRDEVRERRDRVRERSDRVRERSDAVRGDRSDTRREFLVRTVALTAATSAMWTSAPLATTRVAAR